jgi:phosphoribosylanthranilate isomerase
VTAIKFCGMTRVEDVAAAAELGAGYVGCVFAGGPRHRTTTEAAALFACLGGTLSPRRAGVFAAVSAPAAPGVPAAEHAGAAGVLRIRDVAAAVPVDIAQVHGDATGPDVAALRAALRAMHPSREVWVVVRCEGGRLPAGAAALWGAADALLLDAHVPGKLGCTGTTLPWRAMAAGLRELRAVVRPGSRLVLAGGLTPDNVGEAILVLHPDVVDVSSGVERAPGIKDHDRMHAFAEAVRTADATSAPPTPSPIP